jgi:hypothetical protein
MEDIVALIEDSRDLFGQIQELHRESVKAGQTVRTLKPRIKSLLEHQRSVLDYLVENINNAYATKSPRKAYYPVADKPEAFEGRFDKNLPGVRGACPEIAAAVERHQPFQPGKEWIDYLMTLVNDNKHRALSPQSQQQTEVWQNSKGGTVQGISFYGADSSRPTSDPTGFVGPGPWDKTVVTEWHFAKPPVSVLYALGLIQNGVEATILDVGTAANL